MTKQINATDVKPCFVCKRNGVVKASVCRSCNGFGWLNHLGFPLGPIPEELIKKYPPKPKKGKR